MHSFKLFFLICIRDDAWGVSEQYKQPKIILFYIFKNTIIQYKDGELL